MFKQLFHKVNVYFSVGKFPNLSSISLISFHGCSGEEPGPGKNTFFCLFALLNSFLNPLGKIVFIPLLLTDQDGSRRRLPTLPPHSRGASPRASMSGPTMARRECGHIQLGLALEQPGELVVALWAAEGLQAVESLDDVSLPQAYAIARLCSFG